ncbi:hypothetical protein DL93DRAFT_266184 [Clavulina sp. PMI_390]|nr:hypothetical protein DL93DRAFT_266184 [Clavulina sp. PMI_390]
MGDVYPAPYSDAAQTAVVVKYHKVPRDLIGALLPSAAICVNDFLAFNLPQLCVPSNLGDASACLAWSSSPPSSTLSAKLLESLKLPEPEKLYRFLVSAPPKGTQSVRVNSLEFPLGILAVWETYLRAQQLRKYWSQSRRWLEESMRCEPAHSRVFQVALQLFDELKWGAPIYGFKADNLCTSTATLTRILSFSWLATSNIAHMLDLVQTDINDHGLPVRIVDPYFAEKLLMLSGKDANYYRTHSSQRHLRRLGEQFVKGEIQNLAGVVNVDGNHWIAFIANAGAREILIADSMVPRNSLSPSFTRYYPLTKALQWWIFHSSELAGLDITPYSVERPEVSQQTDSNSCGIYAVNYVASYFLPSVYDPLVPMSMRCPRTAAFISIAQRHISSEVSKSIDVSYQKRTLISHLFRVKISVGILDHQIHS